MFICLSSLYRDAKYRRELILPSTYPGLHHGKASYYGGKRIPKQAVSGTEYLESYKGWTEVLALLVFACHGQLFLHP